MRRYLWAAIILVVLLVVAVVALMSRPNPSPTASKPARGGIAAIQRLRAEQARREFQRLLIPPEAARDSAERVLREEELRLRAALERTEDDSAAIVRLAEVLYRLTARTHDRRDLNRALLFWRPHYDLIASSLGDSTARARLGRLEAILLELPADSLNRPSR